jgi:hypothetical protein
LINARRSERKWEDNININGVSISAGGAMNQGSHKRKSVLLFLSHFVKALSF